MNRSLWEYRTDEQGMMNFEGLLDGRALLGDNYHYAKSCFS